MLPLREEGPYSEFFWSVFSRIRTEYGGILRIQSECGKIRTRKTPNTDTFHVVCTASILLSGGNKAIKFDCLITNCNYQYYLSNDYLITNKIRLPDCQFPCYFILFNVTNN